MDQQTGLTHCTQTEQKPCRSIQSNRVQRCRVTTQTRLETVVRNNPTPSRVRRRLLAMTGLLSIAPQWVWSAALVPTPRQTAGPFYPEVLPLDDDSDLTRVAGQDGPAKGSSTELSGRILNTNGQPLAGIRIEIWQCDANGRYHHPRDNRRVSLDERFQGHGHTSTDPDGRYQFRTIHPVPYPGRTPHIHTAVFLPGERPFVTQIYVKDEPRNAQDGLFNRIPAEMRPLVVADFQPTPEGSAEFFANFDVVLGATPTDGKV